MSMSLNSSSTSSSSVGTPIKEDAILPECSDSVLTFAHVHTIGYEDVPAVQNLWTPNTAIMYNTDDVHKMVHTCSVNLLMSNTLGTRTVAGMCLADYPNVPSIPVDDWANWVRRLYGLKAINSYNSFWVHLMVSDELNQSTFIRSIMQYIFHYYNKKHYVLFVVPSVCNKQMKFLEALSTTILPIDHTNPNRVQTLRLLLRQDYAISYKIRRAVEEDNDDLVPLIDMYSRRPRNMYGDFYIAEIITRHQDSGRQIIVAEHKGLAVSVLCLNENVNYADLNRAFNLRPFTGLFKPKSYECDQRLGEVLPVVSEQTIQMDPISKALLSGWLDESTESLSYSLKDEPSVIVQNIDDLNLDLSLADTDAKCGGDVATIEFTKEDESIQFCSQLSLISEAANLSNTSSRDGQFQGHEYSLGLLLEASFECFPNKDYCILSMPPSQPYFSLLRQFVRVTPMSLTFHPHELYVVNKIMLNPVSVRVASGDDVAVVKKFRDALQTPGLLVEKFKDSQDDPDSKLQTFLMICGTRKDDPIGVVMVNECTDIEYIKLKYSVNWWTDIRQEKDTDVGVIEYFCMSPLFRRHCRFFIREIHRMSSYSTLLYAINRYDTGANRERPLPTALSDFSQIPARKICTNPRCETRYSAEPFALYMSTPRLTNVSRFDVNTRIVVVGCSYTAVAFLRALLFSPEKHKISLFNNVTLISMDGMCHRKLPRRIRDMMWAKTTTIDYEYMEKLNLKCYVSVIYGTMTDIDRKEKTVTVNRKYAISYDLLFLMCGLQYGVPRKPNVKDYLSVRLPPNMFNINSEADAKAALMKLKELTSEYKGYKYTIVVYGATIDAYCCVAALLEYGVQPCYLALVEPSEAVIFQDGLVYEVVIDTIKDMGVKMYTGYKLIDWSTTATWPKTVSLKLESYTRSATIEALAVFLYPEKSVNVRAYKAIIQSGIVFDGRVVVTPDCRTNDPYIYAAGSLTKYPRRFFAEQYVQNYYNHEEIGKVLGKRIRSELIPFEEDVPDCLKYIENCAGQVPIYEKPLVTYCILPGGLHYLEVCKPGKQVALETAMADNEYGTAFETGEPKRLSKSGYFCLHLDNCNVVETITCLSLQNFDYKKLRRIWGKHESMLNNLVTRFEGFQISDLFEYFESPWCTAVFHDDFDKFVRHMMRIMSYKWEEDQVSPMDEMREALERTGYKQLTQEQRASIEEHFGGSIYEEAIKNKLVDFIGQNLDSLNMYAHPWIVNNILTGFQANSPLFNKL